MRRKYLPISTYEQQGLTLLLSKSNFRNAWVFSIFAFQAARPCSDPAQRVYDLPPPCAEVEMVNGHISLSCLFCCSFDPRNWDMKSVRRSGAASNETIVRKSRGIGYRISYTQA